jgi:hypothetical protein
MVTTSGVKPIEPERIVDIAWGLSLFFSNDEQEKKFGEYVREKWDELSGRYKDDDNERRYFDNITAALAGTTYNLAQLRHQLADRTKYLEELQIRRIKNLDDLAELSKDAQSIATRLAGLSLGGGVTFLGLSLGVLGVRELFFTIVGAVISYFIFEAILHLYRHLNSTRILKEIQEQKESYRTKEFLPKSEQVLKELLEKVNDISEELYKTRLEPDRVKQLVQASSEVYSFSGASSEIYSKWLTSGP